MATIEKRVNQKGVSYMVRWRDQNGIGRKQTFKRKRDAEVFLNKTMAEVHRGEYSTLKDITFGELSDKYLSIKETEVREKTFAHYKVIVGRLKGRFGETKLKSITNQIIDEYASELKKEISPSLASKTLVILKAILERAVEWGYIAKNPAKKVKKPKVAKPELKFLTKTEMDDLIAATPEEHRALIATACYTGMRQGELLGLMWGDVDFKAGKIYVRRTLQKGKFQEPKTTGSKRQIHVPKFILDYLREQRARQLVEVKSNPNNLVFTTSTGTPLDPSNVTKRVFKRVLSSVTIKNVRFHDLRHSYASMLIDKGANILFVSKQLGHASVTMTLDVYGHLYPDTERVVIEELEKPILHYAVL